jgi:hypothetical protein
MGHDALARFSSSMNLSYEDWHDGVGYDLDALSRLEGDDLRAAEDLLIARNLADVRDVQALDRIGSERAIAELMKGVSSSDLAVRGEVLLRLKIRGLLSDEQVDQALVSALRSVSLLNGLTTILSVASSHRSPAVRKEVLRTALDGAADARCHAAALAHFICGGSTSMFDIAFRPLYLRFNSKSRSARVQAFRELCHLMHLDDDALLAELGVDVKPPWWRFW